ncbi:transcriptional regulator [Aliigemmobacter aestuarii]|uniref:Transcriptional regulator n=1 Tax=Aliigemmobacter aestuarii TaxID=1445661 RepID=A0A4S3MQP2_9RHOB|nr:helix-turn-helix domain-containing protein [Gemmobacter aestuarii]THD84404.1 transcriptional regulator [Gemmobacter aestuarii]
MPALAKGSRKSYDEGCIAAHALDLIGDRWALLVARELMLGPRRFSAIRAGLPGISANVLTQRLDEMEQAGLVDRTTLPEDARATVYGLTRAGQGLWPVLKALCLWGVGQPGHDPSKHISPTALMLSMRALCARDRAGRHLVTVRLGAEGFTIRTAPGAYEVRRERAERAPLRFAGTPCQMARAVYGPAPLADLVAAGMIGFEGNPEEGQRFVDLFALRPPPAVSDRAVDPGGQMDEAFG